MLILSIILYLILSYAITLRINKFVFLSDWAINFFLTTIGLNIIIVELLHFFKSLNNPILFLIIQGTLISILIIVIIDPRNLVFKEKISRLNIKFQNLGITEVILHGIIFSILIFVIYVGLQSPINNSDSLSTHLVRIFYWIQHNSLESWTAIVDTQISYPINISIQGLWIFLLTNSEINFFLIPFLGLVIGLILIYKISIILGANLPGALTACLITLSFPVVLLQTYSFQGDVFIATLALCALYYLLLFMKNNSHTSLYTSIFVMSIGIGAKQTIFLFAPLFGFVIIVLVLKKKIAPHLLLNIIFLFIISFLLFSSFKFIQESQETQVPNPEMVDSSFFNNLITINQKPIRGYLTNGLRYFYQAVDLYGVTGQLKLNLQETKNVLFRKLANKLSIDLESNEFLNKPNTPFSYSMNLPINEDAAWFGILSIPIILIAICITCLKKDKFRIYYLIFSLLLLALFIFGQVILKSGGWGPYRGRHMIIAVLVLMPLVSFVIPKKRLTGSVFTAVLVIASVYLSISILTFNDSRPLIVEIDLVRFRENYVNQIEVTNIFNSQYRIRLYKICNDLIKTVPTRVPIIRSAYYEALYFQNSFYIRDVEFVNHNISEHRPIFLYINKSLLEYSLFGRNKTRALYPVRNLSDVESNSYILVSKNLIHGNEGFNFVAENENYVILFKQ